MGIFEVSEFQYELVYDILSFSLASMMATTLFLWFRISAVHEKFKSALLISGLVTFIASYHYIRIFNSWVDAYQYNPVSSKGEDGSCDIKAPLATGVPFNDAYRYMDWLLTVPLLLIEIILVMKLDSKMAFKKSVQLGTSSALMIVIGYPGELVIGGDLSKRWGFWGAAMVPFVYIVYELCVGLKDALDKEHDDSVKSMIWVAQRLTVVSWLTYPIVYIIPMMGATGAQAVVGIQCGYCASDIISKCGVGLVIYQVTMAKSKALGKGMEEPLMDE